MRKSRKDARPSAQDAYARVAQLEYRLRKLDAFTTAFSHELRDSLFSVGGFARAIELDDDARLGPNSRSCLRSIAQAASRMQRVIDDAMALARGDPLEGEKVDLPLDEMVRDMLRDMQATYPATRVTLSELPIIHADPEVVRLVLRNVIGNAFKYSVLAPEPAVEISLHPSGVLQVLDNGLGFANEDAPKIFEPFVRFTRDPVYPGVGLGLTAVKQALDRHGGRIRAESREGGPTQFTISFKD